MSGNGEGVLSRWSRLKLERAQPRPDGDGGTGGRAETEGPGSAEARGEGPFEPAPVEAEPPAGPDLPDVDSLTAESDFSAFLQEAVPAHLHKLAMRKLWRSDPVFANLDGLNDYDTDFTIKEAMEVAKESAADLARGTKRLNVAEMRAKEREAREAAWHRRGGAGTDPVGDGEARAPGQAAGAGSAEEASPPESFDA